MRKQLGLLLAVALVAASICSCSTTPQLRLLCSNDEQVCAAWARAYSESRNISVHFLRLPTSMALSRLQSRKTDPEFDLWVGGPSENYELAAAKGLLQESMPASAKQVSRHFQSPQHKWFGVYGSLLAVCTAPDSRLALSSWADLANPKYTGRISASSPLSSGTAYSLIQVAEKSQKNPKRTLEGIYNNVGRFTNSGTAPASVVSSGQADIAISFVPYCVANGLSVHYPKDGTTFEIGAAGVLKGAPPPKASRGLFGLAAGKARPADTSAGQSDSVTDQPHFC